MNKKRYKRSRRHPGFVPVLILLSLVMLLVGMSMFFRVTDITVDGAAYYTAEQVTEASGIRTGQSLLALSRSRAAVKICSELLFVKEVRITKSYPGTVRITVTESMPVAYVRDNTDFWTLDSDGQVLEKRTSADVEGLIGVRGVSKPVLESGKLLSSEDSSEDVSGNLAKVLQALAAKEYSFTPDWIDLTDLGNISVHCANGFTIALGGADMLQEKLTLADAVMQKQEDGASGTVDVSQGNTAHFIPDSAG